MLLSKTTILWILLVSMVVFTNWTKQGKELRRSLTEYIQGRYTTTQDNFFTPPGIQTNLNQIESTWIPGENYFSLSLSSSSDDELFAKLQKEKVKVGFFGEKGNQLFTKDVTLNEGKNSIDYDSITHQVQAIIQNIDNKDYIMITLDKTSNLWAKENILLIENNKTRDAIWRSLYDRVNNLTDEFSSIDFVDVIVKNIKQERNLKTILLNSSVTLCLIGKSVISGNIVKKD